MPTTVTSSISKSGTPDYSTPQLWEDDCPANLVTADQVWRGVIDKPTDNYSGTGIQLQSSSITTDATRYMELTTAPGASFRDHASASTNALRFNTANGCSIESTNFTPAGAVQITSVDHFRVSGIQFKGALNTPALSLSSGSTDFGKRIDNCILETSGTGNTRVGQFDSSLPRVTNCLFIYNGSDASSNILHNNVPTGKTATYVNCTFIKTSASPNLANAVVLGGLGTVNLTNCAVYGGGNGVTFTGTVNATTCYSNDTTPITGMTTVSLANAAFESSTSGSHDFRLKSTSDLIDVGTTDALGTPDILGTARPTGSFDIGAFEFVDPNIIGRAFEADSAFTAPAVSSVVIGQAAETDFSTASSIGIGVLVDQAVEADSAKTFGITTTIPVVRALPEIDTAQSVTPLGTKAVASTLETDTTLPTRPIDVIKTQQAVEEDTAQPVQTDERIGTLLVVEIDSAQTVQSDTRIETGSTLETDTAQVVATDDRISILQTVEVDNAVLVKSDDRVSVLQTTEIDTAVSVSTDDRVITGAAAEVDSTRSVNSAFGTVVNLVTTIEVDVAFSVVVDIGGFAYRVPDTTKIDLYLAQKTVDVVKTDPVIDLSV